MTALLASLCLSAVSFPFQGSICGDNGQPTGATSTNVELRLYETIDRSDALWGRTCAVNLQTNGLFAVKVCDEMGTPFELVRTNRLEDALRLLGTRPFYLGVKIVGRPLEVRPRSRVMPLPSVLVADSADAAAGPFKVTGTVRVSGSESVDIETNLNVQKSVDAFQLKRVNEMKVENDTTVTNLLVGSGGFSVQGELSARELVARDLVASKGLKAGAAVAAQTITANEVAVGALVGPGAFAATNATPKGMIVMWYGDISKLPAGWTVCDGKTIEGYKTPDLRGRFIIGATRSGDVGADGTAYPLHNANGAESVSLNANHLPPHTHTISEYQHDYCGYNMYEDYHEESFTLRTSDWDRAATRFSNRATEDTGFSEAHNNMPPYYALYYIVKYR